MKWNISAVGWIWYLIIYIWNWRYMFYIYLTKYTFDEIYLYWYIWALQYDIHLVVAALSEQCGEEPPEPRFPFQHYHDYDGDNNNDNGDLRMLMDQISLETGPLSTCTRSASDCKLPARPWMWKTGHQLIILYIQSVLTAKSRQNVTHIVLSLIQISETTRHLSIS